ncbi:hypothetical protein OEG84_10080 [Hoeflea sp. G2-23]|uniref:Uncharacterized protein n=1 Tax=Hoeflea algicola TaxID=2983763 RepID=A0ABT3Z8E2_9HYPH|nr:hypothetical protein [Hoeflea algicola]MCY0148048.1 hypothetical protein [Hoeflea algicola]
MSILLCPRHKTATAKSEGNEGERCVLHWTTMNCFAMGEPPEGKPDARHGFATTLKRPTPRFLRALPYVLSSVSG